jgi:hypothetical protein
MGGINSKYYKDFSETELQHGYDYMCFELFHLPLGHPIKELFLEAWFDFSCDRFSYDGATFVKERNPSTLFEVAAFIHDWRNSLGYVGKEVDREFLSIMIVLNYKPELIIDRRLFMLLTPLNVARHKFLSTYKKGFPDNLYQL